MGNIIIDNQMEGLTDLDALSYVRDMISEGRVSNDGKQYCYHTGIRHKDTYVSVVTFLNKKSDRFLIIEWRLRGKGKRE